MRRIRIGQEIRKRTSDSAQLSGKRTICVAPKNDPMPASSFTTSLASPQRIASSSCATRSRDATSTVSITRQESVLASASGSSDGRMGRGGAVSLAGARFSTGSSPSFSSSARSAKRRAPSEMRSMSQSSCSVTTKARRRRGSSPRRAAAASSSSRMGASIFARSAAGRGCSPSPGSTAIGAASPKAAPGETTISRHESAMMVPAL